MADRNLLSEKSCCENGDSNASRNAEIIKKDSNAGQSSSWSYRSIPKRYFVIFMLFMFNILEGFVLINMSIVIVDITHDKKIIRDNETYTSKAEYNWTPMEQSLVLSMAYLGQTLAAFTGAVIHKSGGVTYLKIGKLGEAIICLISPVVISVNVYLFIVCRFILGLFEGLSFVGAPDVYVHWTPPKERVRSISWPSIGLTIGLATCNPVSGFIAQNFGWKPLFYVPGVVLLFLSIIWILFVSNDPAEDKFISEKERSYLCQVIDYVSKEKISLPWRSILTSIPVYALLIEFFVTGFTLSLGALIPLYVKDVIQDTSIQTVGLISGIPDFITLISRPFCAHFFENMRPRHGINKVHKTNIFLGDLIIASCFIIAVNLKDAIGRIISLTVFKILLSVTFLSYYVLPIDIAEQYAGFVQSLTQLARCSALFLNPVLLGLLVPTHTQSEWNVYLLFLSFLVIFGAIVFLIFGSGSVQPWAKNSTKRDTKDCIN